MGRGEGGWGPPLEGRWVLAFEGLSVAGIGGPGTLRKGRGGRRDAERRSPGPADAATPRFDWQEPRLEPGCYWGDALLANFESSFGCLGRFQQNTPPGHFNPPPGRFQHSRQEMFPSSAWFSLATWWLSFCTQRYLFLHLSELG